ncbi:anchored repeat-type ABC transporter permease subunit [Agromyces atrinae]|uniref:anchored repeat-type ABC transporter permease subunit n=1 Tax=Agromyces atrinae TaxID=592376 RepID=UPI001F5A9EBC|nr:anchored repeat-type ABC transporter permease subunit [Agromyces atrinae]MCI2956661.1 anchored repeat-type ABC transporter permease subunit [Agromyces atrinae]
MMSPIDFFIDLFNPDLAFLPKALAVAVMSSIVCGVVGTYVVLRGMAFIGDAVAHAVFPGLAVAFVVSGNLVLGGTLGGILTAILIAVFSQNRRLKEDSIIGVFFVAAFALGIVIISQAPGYAGSLQQFLFGSITGIPDSDLFVAAGMGLIVLAALFAFHKEFVTISLDRESAQAMGVPVFWLDLVLYVLVTLAVVISVQTIGNILVLALLITPAATARLLTDRLGIMMTLAPIIGGASALIGLYVSWSWDVPTGGTIVLVLTAAFLAAWFFAPRNGLIARSVRGRRAADSASREASEETAPARDLVRTGGMP